MPDPVMRSDDSQDGLSAGNTYMSGPSTTASDGPLNHPASESPHVRIIHIPDHPTPRSTTWPGRQSSAPSLR
jgi:hypothetical protein